MTDPTTGHFVWYELMTRDLDAAQQFYASVAGWDVQPSPMPDMDYRLAHAGGERVAGLMTLPDELSANGVPPAWVGYVGVANVDDAVTRFANDGGHIQRAPTDIPEVGRFAVASDPQGATVMLFTPAPGDAGAPPNSMDIGHFGWNELHTSNAEAAMAFYAAQFGWVADEPLDMGEMGKYHLFRRADQVGGEMQCGGMMNSPLPQPAWLYYISVDDIDAALARATDGGGTAMMGPAQVPGGMFAATIRDPQGAVFGMVGPRAAGAGA